MLKNEDSIFIPQQFMVCYKGDCCRAGECLRHQAIRHIPEKLLSVLIVNPAQIHSNEGCDHFKPCRMLKYGYGLSQTLDRLPYQMTKELKLRMREHFGKTHFYRLMRQQYRFTPEDQAYVEALFEQQGVGEVPVFDSYTYDYEW